MRTLRAAGCAPWLTVNEPGRTYVARSQAAAGTVPVRDPASMARDSCGDLATAAKRLSVAVVLPSAKVHFFVLAGQEADFPRIALGAPSRESVERATDKGYGKER